MSEEIEVEYLDEGHFHGMDESHGHQHDIGVGHQHQEYHQDEYYPGTSYGSMGEHCDDEDPHHMIHSHQQFAVLPPPIIHPQQQFAQAPVDEHLEHARQKIAQALFQHGAAASMEHANLTQAENHAMLQFLDHTFQQIKPAEGKQQEEAQATGHGGGHGGGGFGAGLGTGVLLGSAVVAPRVYPPYPYGYPPGYYPTYYSNEQHPAAPQEQKAQIHFVLQHAPQHNNENALVYKRSDDKASFKYASAGWVDQKLEPKFVAPFLNITLKTASSSPAKPLETKTAEAKKPATSSNKTGGVHTKIIKHVPSVLYNNP